MYYTILLGEHISPLPQNNNSNFNFVLFHLLFFYFRHRLQHAVPQSVVGGDEEATNCIRDQKEAKGKVKTMFTRS